MKPFKPLLLKTYGKQRRKIPAWVSPEDRRRAFDSTPSSDSMSELEPPRPQGTRAALTKLQSQRKVRSAKRKAQLCLAKMRDDEECVFVDENLSPPCLVPLTRGRNAREKHTEAGSHRNVRSAKRKAELRLSVKIDDEDKTSDEENISPPSLVPFWQSKNTSVHLASAGRFVTRRRCAASTKPPKVRIITLDSSDDFTSGAIGSRRIHRASRRRRRNQPAIGLSSAESSVNTAGASSFTNIPFREISLNESGDHSLGPCYRKPIFCSTPSAASFAKRGLSKPFALQSQVISPPSVSVSCIGVSNTFQEDLDSPRQPCSPPQSASPSGVSNERLQRNKEQSLDLLIEPKGGSCSEGGSKATYDVELLSGDLFSADSESSSRFVSAAGGLEWLIEALKQKCLSQRCTVQLERLSFLPVTQLWSQTTYSSCLERSGSVDSQQIKRLLWFVHSSQNDDHPQSSAGSLHGCFSATNNESSDYLGSAVSCDPSENGSPSDDYKKSAELSRIKACMEQSESVTTDHSNEIIKHTQLPSRTRVQTLFTDMESKAAKDKCVKKCFILMQKTQLPNLHLKGFARQKEAGVTCERSVIIDNKQSEREGSELSLRKSRNGSVAKAESRKASESKSPLEEKCLTGKHQRRTLQSKHAPHKSSTDVSESARDAQPEICQLSESDDDNAAASSKISTKCGSTARSKTASREEVEKSHKSVSKREETLLVPKGKRSENVFTQQTGTSRKACVSGVSVSRWKNRGGGGRTLRSRVAKTGNAKAGKCSIGELISKQHTQSMELETTVNFSTPPRASQISVSSLLADFSPSTHTWSRLKASLCVHRKVQLTPKGLHLSTPSTLVREGLADVSQDLFASPLRAMLPSHLRSQLLSQQSLPLCEDAELSDAEKVYTECGQQHPLTWEQCILPHRMKQCVKIGEGTFGEVFSTTNSSGDTVALKIIPVEGREKVNGEDQKTFGEILHEIIISKELSSLKEKQQNQTHGFIGLHDLHCVQGRYPADFLKAWDAFDQRKGSENDRPDFFKSAQLFIILEFEFGGLDLENSSGTLASLGMAKSILHQVTAALAVAEQELRFEHRDLHWGNVLVKTTNQKAGSFCLNGTTHSVETKGVLVRIIDYSLSRVEIDDLTVSCDISNDEELFTGQGDYQFEIYRLMRQENGNDWSTYNPHTNVLWLHYLCSKLLPMKYRSSRGKAVRKMREELTCFYNNVLQYSSATEALQNCPLFQQQ
ncbi:serine/threonine-protein kinase haspin [Kryptolebias marmoratus]|uniref:Serine/threonine-protein kinase haspin n=1 Tax=Kryptolebias marmoratus TaxID=37003 RepID=A0A3Q2Z9I4_KRYMA|nr:serine/threonine-protein kinase haspin [Kryptolebias marmoratus]